MTVESDIIDGLSPRLKAIYDELVVFDGEQVAVDDDPMVGAVLLTFWTLNKLENTPEHSGACLCHRRMTDWLENAFMKNGQETFTVDDVRDAIDTIK